MTKRINTVNNQVFYRRSFRFLLFFLVFFNALQSQCYGYLGKKWIVKTNVINGREIPFNSLEVEKVIRRQLALSFSIQRLRFRSPKNGVSLITGIISPGNSRASMKETSTLKDGAADGWMTTFGLKYYVNNIIPAPLGWYIQASLGLGAVKLHGYNVNYRYELEFKESNPGKEIEPRKSVSNLNGDCLVFFFEPFSFGYHRIFKRTIVLDASLSAQGQFCTLPDNVINAFEENFFTRTNVYSFAKGKLAFGPSAYIKVGFLIR